MNKAQRREVIGGIVVLTVAATLLGVCSLIAARSRAEDQTKTRVKTCPRVEEQIPQMENDLDHIQKSLDRINGKLESE